MAAFLAQIHRQLERFVFKPRYERFVRQQSRDTVRVKLIAYMLRWLLCWWCIFSSCLLFFGFKMLNSKMVEVDWCEEAGRPSSLQRIDTGCYQK